MEKLLTVCIPTFNMEALLGRCLDSFILEPEYMNKMQIIVVNDGSWDNSSKIGHEYEAKFPNTFKIIDKPNGNYGSCINAALKVATGKYFRICDSDDRYEKANLAKYIELLCTTTADIVFSPYYILDFDSNINRKMDVAPTEKGKVVDISSVEWSKDIYKRYRAMHCMAVKTYNLKQNNYVQTEGISYTDTQFVFYSILYSDTCTFFDEPIYYYYLGRDGQTMSLLSMIKSNMHFYQNANKMLQTYVEIPSGLDDNKRNLLFRCIKAELMFFVSTVLGNIKDSSIQRNLINEMIEQSQTSILPCPLYESLLDNKFFKWWKIYHISPVLIFYTNQLIQKVICFLHR